jgi:hippurate hydrolase
MSHSLLESTQALQSQTIALRREIHRHPKLGQDLPRTQGSLIDPLTEFALSITLSKKTSGIISVLRDEQPSPSVVL